MIRMFLGLSMILAQDAATIASMDRSPTTSTRFCPMIPEGTPLAIRTLQDVDSEKAKIGDMFPVELAAPLILDGVEILPAGISGMGEVIHANRARGDQSGELIVAARYLTLGDAHLPLRGFRIAGGGVEIQTGLGKYSTTITFPAGMVAMAKVAGPCS